MAGQNYSRNIRQALLYDYIKKPQYYDDSSPPEDMWRGGLIGEMAAALSLRAHAQGKLSVSLDVTKINSRRSKPQQTYSSHRLLSAADWSDEMRELDAVPGGAARL